jgi:dihydrolipoamide dehydrogenase
MKTVVLGGGPGGYVCAIRLARLGADVTLVEAAKPGGVCLHAGCIPTKALLHVAELYAGSRASRAYGVINENTALDWQKALAYKNNVIAKLSAGVTGLIKANKIELIEGFGAFTGKNELLVTGREGERNVPFDTAVIAAGSKPKILPIPGASLEGVVTSTEALSFPAVPESLAIIGGGVIGCEFAALYSRLGTKVTILEALEDILFTLDRDLIKTGKRSLSADGVTLHTNASVRQISRDGGNLALHVAIKNGGGGETKTVLAEKILIAAGRTPNTESIGLDSVGIKTESGFIPVEKKTLRTVRDNIYAIGDCINTPQLAHAASAEGEAAAAAIMGHDEGICLDVIPSCVYIHPELASAGRSEQELEKQGVGYISGVFPIMANGRAAVLGERLGMAKVLAEKTDRRILGVHLASPNATEIISQAALALSQNMTVEQFARVIATHPSVHEALHEAALAILGGAVHLPPKN